MYEKIIAAYDDGYAGKEDDELCTSRCGTDVYKK